MGFTEIAHRRYITMVERRQQRIKENLQTGISNAELHQNHFDSLRTHNSGQLRSELLGTIIATGMLEQDRDAVKKIRKATDIAKAAHKGQGRKFSKDEYIAHPYRVALLTIDIAKALDVPLTADLVVSALLHDTIEDNPDVTQQTLEREFKKFGLTFAQTIAEDTEAFNHNTPSREKRLSHDSYAAKITNTTDETTLLKRLIIKTADRINNLLDPLEHPSGENTEQLRKSREKTIRDTRTELFPVLLDVTPEEEDTPMKNHKKTLQTLLTDTARLAQVTLDDPDFSHQRAGEYLAHAA